MKIRPPRWPLALTLLAAGSCDRDAGGDSSDAFRFVNNGDVFTLDLNQMSYGQDIRVTYMMREGLYSPTGPQYSPVPAGATGVDVSADKLTYTFHLRPGAKWSNGDPVTAADYVFSWRYMLEQPGEYTYLFYYIKGAEAYKNDYAAGRGPSFDTVGVTAVDPLTLRVSLRQPVTYLLDLMAFTPFYPRNQRSMEPFRQVDAAGRVTYDARYTKPPAVACNGPFVLTEWAFKRVLRFEKNSDYWDTARVRVNEIDMVVNDNPLSTYLQFTAGAVDWVVQVSPEIAIDLKDHGVAGLQTSPAFGTQFLSLNCGKTLPGGKSPNPLADARVRQALAMTIDKAFITGQITRMGERPAEHYVPPGTIPGFVSLPGLRHDPDAARRLLADAGYPQGRGLPRLTILYNSENATRGRIAQVLKQQWQQTLGVDVEIDGVEGASYKQRVSKHDFAIAMVAWFGDYPDVSTFTDKYASASTQNEAAWSDPRYDRDLAAAAAEADPAKRFDLLRHAEMLLNTQAPIIPLYHPVNVSLLNGRVGNLPSNPRMLTDWRAVTLRPAAGQ